MELNTQDASHELNCVNIVAFLPFFLKTTCPNHLVINIYFPLVLFFEFYCRFEFDRQKFLIILMLGILKLIDNFLYLKHLYKGLLKY